MKPILYLTALLHLTLGALALRTGAPLHGAAFITLGTAMAIYTRWLRGRPLTRARRILARMDALALWQDRLYEQSSFLHAEMQRVHPASDYWHELHQEHKALGRRLAATRRACERLAATRRACERLAATRRACERLAAKL